MDLPQLQPWDPQSANETCDCLTGPRDCFADATTASVAVVGGLTPIDDPVDQVEVIAENGAHGEDDLVPDLPEEASRR